MLTPKEIGFVLRALLNCGFVETDEQRIIIRVDPSNEQNKTIVVVNKRYAVISIRGATESGMILEYGDNSAGVVLEQLQEAIEQLESPA